jgi:hypothetical protein
MASLDKKNLLKLILVAIALGCSIILITSFIVTWNGVQGTSVETTELVMLIYVSASVPVLSVCMFCVALYLLINSASQQLKTDEVNK